jgi:uncharacterized protein involved in type VI secretion and phage assembly
MTTEHAPITLLNFPLNNRPLKAVKVEGEDYLSSPFYFKLTLTTNHDTLVLEDLIKQPVRFQLGQSTPYHCLIYHAN